MAFCYDADVVAAVSVVPCFVAAVVVSASAVLLFSGALVVPALAGSFHCLVAGFAALLFYPLLEKKTYPKMQIQTSSSTMTKTVRQPEVGQVACMVIAYF